MDDQLAALVELVGRLGLDIVFVVAWWRERQRSQELSESRAQEARSHVKQIIQIMADCFKAQSESGNKPGKEEVFQDSA